MDRNSDSASNLNPSLNPKDPLKKAALRPQGRTHRSSSRPSMATLAACAAAAAAVTSIASLPGCGKQETITTENGAEVAAAAGVSALSGALSSTAIGSTMAMLPALEGKAIARQAPARERALTIARSAIDSTIERFLVPSAQATVTTCGDFPFVDSCDSSAKTRSASYTNCAIGSTGLTYSGTVTLEFSRSSCVLLSANDTVTRTVNMNRTGANSTNIATTSDSHTDFRGATIAGGARITKTGSSSFEVDILGMRKKKTDSSGAALYDVSLRTTQPFSASNVTQSTITIDGGAFEAIHNIAEYVATFTASNVTWDYSNCCYPTSGKFAIAYSGSVAGSATVTFGNTCGSATFSKSGESTSLTFPGCQ